MDTLKEEGKAPTTPAMPLNGGWKLRLNAQEQEEIENSIKSVNEFSQDLQRVRDAVKNRQPQLQF